MLFSFCRTYAKGIFSLRQQGTFLFLYIVFAQLGKNDIQRVRIRGFVEALQKLRHPWLEAILFVETNGYSIT
jgi:hypothetical protein